MTIGPGQVAVVTGAGSGIGRALAHGLAARGARLALADVEEEALAETAASLRDAGADVLDRSVDVRHATEVDVLATAVRDRFGRVDLVCLNAGVVGPRRPVWEQHPADWDWVLSVNLGGVANGLRAFVPGLVAEQRGHVLVTASTAALHPVRGGGNGPYAASKHAVLGICETLREELASAAPDVGVTVLCPGPVATRIRDSERNRPVDLRAGGADRGDALPQFAHRVPSVSAEYTAERALAGVSAGAFLVLPNEGSAEEAREHAARLHRDALPG